VSATQSHPAATRHGGETRDGNQRQRPLKHEEKVELALLALPTFALALAITIVSTQLGEVTRAYTHQTTVIGAIIGGEGAMALWVPLIFGSWSDTLRTRIGGRLPFVLAGGLPAAAVLALIGVLHGLGLIAMVAALFFFFYFIAYEPYRAMYPDMLPSDEIGGRAQSAQAVARGVGTGVALLGGGLLLSVARPLPFVVSAVVVVAALCGFVVLILRRGTPPQDYRSAEGPVQVTRRLRRLVKEHPALRAYFFANALWETTLAALKAFIVLYLTLGLGYSLSTGSLLIGGVAVVILVGAAGSGKLGDKFGRIRVVAIALVGYGVGYLVPVFTTSRVAIGVAMPFIAIGGGTVMTMAYALLMPLMPKDEHGALTGFYSISRGVGIVLGPILAGALIWLTKEGVFKATNGFQAMWIVCAAATFGSLFFLRRMAKAVEDRRELEADDAGDRS
jgi:MFS family permease